MNAKLGLLLLLTLSSSPARADEDDDGDTPSWGRVQIVVLATSRNHEGTLEEAKKAAAALGFAFSDRDLVYDDENGLRWPPDYDDDMWAGGYFPRRYDESCGNDRGATNGCITVERSDSYPGLKPGYFIAVAGLLHGEEARERLAEVRHIAPDAYLAETKVYLGCLH